jgi:hypothetical protein
VEAGAPGRDRTCNPRLRRPVLYPIELRAPDTVLYTVLSGAKSAETLCLHGSATLGLLLRRPVLYPAELLARADVRGLRRSLAAGLLDPRPLAGVSGRGERI